jgi:general secretion pathway protein C
MIAMPSISQGNGSRFIKKGLPTLVNVLLIVPLTFGFSKFSEQFFAAKNQTVHTQTTQQFTTIPATQKISRVNHQEIARWHLFGTQAVKQAPAEPKKRVAPQTKLKLTLRGIAAQDDKLAGLAIIQQPNKEEKHFKTGDNIFGLAKLEEIHTDRVILSRNGQYETLQLPKLDSSRKAPVRTTSLKTRKTSVRSITPVQTNELDDDFGEDDDFADDEEFWEYLDFEPAMIDGKIAGLKLITEEESDNKILISKGLMPGDIITSVNGHVMNNGASVSEAINAIADDERLEIVVKRNGKPKNLVITK